MLEPQTAVSPLRGLRYARHWYRQCSRLAWANTIIYWWLQNIKHFPRMWYPSIPVNSLVFSYNKHFLKMSSQVQGLHTSIKPSACNFLDMANKQNVLLENMTSSFSCGEVRFTVTYIYGLRHTQCSDTCQHEGQRKSTYFWSCSLKRARTQFHQHQSGYTHLGRFPLSLQTTISKQPTTSPAVDIYIYMGWMLRSSITSLSIYLVTHFTGSQ